MIYCFQIHKLFRELKRFLPPTLEELVKKDLEEYKKKAAVVTTTEEKVDEDGTVTTTTTTTSTKVETVVKKGGPAIKTETKAADKPPTSLTTLGSTPIEHSASGTTTPATNASNEQPELTKARQGMRFAQPRGENVGDPPDTPAPDKGKVTLPQESSDKVVIGLRVYSNKDVTCSVEGRLRAGSDPTVPAVAAETTVVTVV